MQNLVIRPTLKSIKLISELEYLFGRWGENSIVGRQDFQALAKLSPGVTIPEIIIDFKFSKNSLFELASKFGASFRTEKLIFTDHNSRPIFTAASPFIIEQRLNELIIWTKQELTYNEIHPIIICSLFHLIFLHIHPFSHSNHAISLISTWFLLKEHTCRSFESISLGQCFYDKREQYFQALKQGEKTCFADWSTANAWIEFFLEALLSAQQNLNKEFDSTIKLNDTQKKILNCIEELGVCKREEIINKTGINIATVKYNLGVLTKRGCLKRNGEGRASSYAFLKKIG